MAFIAFTTEVSAQEDNSESWSSMKATPLTFEAIEPASICFENHAAGPVTYRVNDGEPQEIAAGDEEWIDLDNPGDKVCFYGDNASYTGTIGNSYRYSSIYDDGYGEYEDGHYYVYGNIMSLVNSTDFATATTLTGSNAFAYLFNNRSWDNTEMKSHPTKDLVLPATTLTADCYEGLFYKCKGLTRAPALPATTLAANCYKEMFRECTNLEAVTALPATTLASSCYSEMFYGCTGVTTAPALPATTLTINCYQRMFSGCTSLDAAPALPSTNLAQGCYQQMFQGCTNLSAAPTLPATTLAYYCYDYMFSGCASLKEAPALPATVLTSSCYYGMFVACTSLTSAPTLPATEMAGKCYEAMFSDCTSLTAAPALPALQLADECYSGMFSGCTALTTAPDLPALQLADGCYSGMFSDCSALTTAPDLLASKLRDNCYEDMFKGCTNLNAVKCLASSISAEDCTCSWLEDVSPTGTFTMAASVRWKEGEDGIPTGWTVVETNEQVLAPTRFYNRKDKVYDYWTTFYHPTANFEADASTTVYTATVNGDVLDLTEVADGIIMAGQGVLLKSSKASMTLTLTSQTGTASYYDGNQLLGSATDIEQESHTSYYVFDDGFDEPTFDDFSYDVIPAQTVYIKLSDAEEVFWIDVLPPDGTLSGDANGDGKVDIADVAEIVNYLKDSPSARFNAANADADDDGEVTPDDVVAVVNMILENINH